MTTNPEGDWKGWVVCLGSPNHPGSGRGRRTQADSRTYLEADFQDGSYGYRPKRTAHDAIARVADAIIRNHTRVIDVDLKDYFGSIRQDLLLKKVAKRIDDDRVMRLLKLILKKSGKHGIAQGGPLTPLTQ